VSLKSAIHIGISLTEYNDMTPYELSLCIIDFNEKQKAHIDKEKSQLEEKLMVAYFGAYWQRVEKLSPKNLEDVLKRLNHQEKKKMTNEEILNEVKKLNAAFGGTTF
jgi:SOS-response transcriptional repressor LexA